MKSLNIYAILSYVYTCGYFLGLGDKCLDSSALYNLSCVVIHSKDKLRWAWAQVKHPVIGGLQYNLYHTG